MDLFAGLSEVYSRSEPSDPLLLRSTPVAHFVMGGRSVTVARFPPDCPPDIWGAYLESTDGASVTLFWRGPTELRAIEGLIHEFFHLVDRLRDLKLTHPQIRAMAEVAAYMFFTKHGLDSVEPFLEEFSRP